MNYLATDTKLDREGPIKVSPVLLFYRGLVRWSRHIGEIHKLTQTAI
ncbi:hypothetical protein N8642_04535 [bacterium]|nr:hypothetical protein [bacterium]